MTNQEAIQVIGLMEFIAEHDGTADIAVIREAAQMAIDALKHKRLTRWEGRDEDGPRAVLVRRDNFNAAMQEALRKLAKYEDLEET